MCYRSSSCFIGFRQFLNELCPFLDLEYSFSALFYTTVFRNGTYYGMVMSFRLSVSPSVRSGFPHFFSTCFEVLSWNFVYGFVIMCYRSSSCFIGFRQFLNELCPFLDLEYSFSALFFYMLWGIELKFCIWLCNHVLQIKFVFHWISSIFEWVMPLFGLRIFVFRTFLYDRF